MATPLYKIPSTPVYAICSDFVVLLILDAFFRFYILHRLNSIPSISSTQSGSGKRVKSGLSWSHRPVPFSLQSRVPTFRHLCPEYRFFFSNTASCIKILANPASQVLVTSLISQSRNLAFSRVPHYISVNPESREFSPGSMVLHSNYKCSLKLPLAGSPHNPFFTDIIPLEYHTFELNSIKEFI